MEKVYISSVISGGKIHSICTVIVKDNDHPPDGLNFDDENFRLYKRETCLHTISILGRFSMFFNGFRVWLLICQH